MQGFNMGRYVPPDQEGVTSANKLAGKHPLGARARHLHTTGALIVRFEMPFAVWCTTCKPNETIIGQGVRFNAEKKKVGNYHSTPVYSFRMKHTVCGGWIEIRTDPQNTAYVVVEGGRKRDTGDDKEAQPGEIVIRPWGFGEQDPAEKDPFAKLEGKVEDKQRAQTESRRILELQERQNRDWEDPYEKSRRLRRSFRTERKGLEKAAANREALQDKMSLGIELVDETEGDRQRARLVDFGDDRSAIGTDAFQATRTRPMFEASVPETSSGAKSQKTKRSSRETKADKLAARHKASLRHALTGNTRAVVDPFLSDLSAKDDVWKPGVKRRKTASNTPGSQRSTNYVSKPGESDHTPKSETGSMTPETDSPSVSVDKSALSKTAPPMLVGYTSDSE
ncbi:hypothetical protein N7509_010171 [Penicillium cosmopolitanum]|uniref:Uncharacterized protein n=1 Tax=Penicillium cosmopolitanum TaxID=1131564 RepID=A0A9W9VR08_9EURO|nr:uncharacterized protein N7509_010171 [Penicillium cosmopolitanum]KAJ5387630.1 hypothetical protein N7509_010171 [Penicillium cosmopolitanum]